MKSNVEQKEGLAEEQQMVSWSAYHASQATPSDAESLLDISSLLPFFQEEAKSVAMIRHSMDIIGQTEFPQSRTDISNRV